jgi:hypothetical protein
MSIEERYNIIKAKKLADEQQNRLTKMLKQQSTDLYHLFQIFQTRKKHTYRVFLSCTFSYISLVILILFQVIMLSAVELSNNLFVNLLLGAFLLFAFFISFFIAALVPAVVFLLSVIRGSKINKTLNSQLNAFQLSVALSKEEEQKLPVGNIQKINEFQEKINWLTPRVKALRRINILLCLSSASMVLCYLFLFGNFGFSLMMSMMKLMYNDPRTLAALAFFLVSVVLLVICASEIFKFKFNESSN